MNVMVQRRGIASDLSFCLEDFIVGTESKLTLMDGNNPSFSCLGGCVRAYERACVHACVYWQTIRARKNRLSSPLHVQRGSPLFARSDAEAVHGRYGLGTKRSFDEWQQYCGVEFRSGTLSERALRGGLEAESELMILP